MTEKKKKKSNLDFVINNESGNLKGNAFLQLSFLLFISFPMLSAGTAPKIGSGDEFNYTSTTMLLFFPNLNKSKRKNAT